MSNLDGDGKEGRGVDGVTPEARGSGEALRRWGGVGVGGGGRGRRGGGGGGGGKQHPVDGKAAGDPDVVVRRRAAVDPHHELGVVAVRDAWKGNQARAKNTKTCIGHNGKLTAGCKRE